MSSQEAIDQHFRNDDARMLLQISLLIKQQMQEQISKITKVRTINHNIYLEIFLFRAPIPKISRWSKIVVLIDFPFNFLAGSINTEAGQKN